MISKEEALAKSKYYYDITKKALEYTKIEEKIDSFGEVELVGSYKYDLMGKPDADFHVYTEPDIEKVADLVSEYLKMPKIIKAQVVNYTKFPPMHEWSLPGIWLGLKVDIDGELVNFDIWFVRREDEHKDEFSTKMPKEWWKRLTLEQKETIVCLKALSRKLYLEREYMSTEIYRAVVLGDVMNQNDLKLWGKANPAQ